jgi:serine/threonine-protein kinase
MAKHPLQKLATEQLNEGERLVALDDRLTAVLKGAEPRDSAERIDLAALAQQPYKRQYVAAARFYAEAFAAQPKIADDLRVGRRYDAACVAAMAAAGKSAGDTKLDDQERTRLRQQALGWLKADLAALAKLADGTAAQRDFVRRKMAHWHADADLARVRDEVALGKLPTGERDARRKLWDNADDMFRRVGDKK